MKYYYDRSTSVWDDGRPMWQDNWSRPWGRTPSEGRRFRAMYCAANLTLLKAKIKSDFVKWGKLAEFDALTKEAVLEASEKGETAFEKGVVIHLGDEIFTTKKGHIWKKTNYIKVWAM